MSSRLSRLEEIRTNLVENPDTFFKQDKNEFWMIVGEIKRETSSDEQEIVIASEIRDILYSRRLGDVHPLTPHIYYLNLIGLGFLLIAGLFVLESLRVVLMIFSWLLLAAFMVLYFKLVNLETRTLKIILLVLVVGLTIILDAILYNLSTDMLVVLYQLYALTAIPCFYLNGRLAGGKIGNINFDGISRDVFGLFTLKINYPSYLRALPPNRQWVFLLGGLGTVFTGILGSTIVLLVYGNPWLFLFPAILFILEILDYLDIAGPLSGAEFNHLRRERRIIDDWKRVNN